MTPTNPDPNAPRNAKALAKRLGIALAKHREERGLSASGVARDAGLSRSYLSYVENGKFGEIGIDKFSRIIEVLGVSADSALQEAGYLDKQPEGLMEPRAYLSTIYDLSPEQVDQAIAFLDFLAEREHSPKQ